MRNTKKKTWTTYKKDTKVLVKRFKYILLLNNWTLEIVFLKNDDNEIDQPGWNTAAKIDVNSRYYSAVITFFQTHFELYKENDYNYKKTIVHELCHILTDPLYLIAEKATPPNQEEYLNNIREQSTEQLANIINNLV